jgi:transcriptional regulator with XRE-family HTH domain
LTINARIKEIRKALNLLQRDFSKGIYLSQSFYASIELENRNVNPRTIELISYKYSVNREYI